MGGGQLCEEKKKKKLDPEEEVELDGGREENTSEFDGDAEIIGQNVLKSDQ